MKKFLIIDGNSIMNRAFYGLSVNMTSSYAGIHTNALYGFLNIYWMILEQTTPDYISVAFDLNKPTFRHQMYAEYKGTRKGMPEELREQMPVIKEILTAMNIPILELEGYEADDILGTVAHQNTQKNMTTYILTGDKDALQLVSDTTSVIIPTTRFGKTEYTVYTPDILLEKQGIEPYQVIHIKSLMGDTSDNIPGVKGIGEKTAYSLIGNYTTLEAIYENIDTLDVTPKVKEKLVLGKETAFLSKELATIDVTIPIVIPYEEAKKSDVNLSELYTLFQKLEFHKFMTKFDFSSVEQNGEEAFGNETKSIDLSVAHFYTIDSHNIQEKYEEIVACMEREKVSYLLNVESEHFLSSIYLGNKPLFAIYNNETDSVYVLNLKALQISHASLVQEMFQTFVTSKSEKLGYQVKQDLFYFFDHGYETVNHFSYDILIAYYLLDSNKSNYSFDYILYDLFHVPIDKSEEDKKKEQKQISFFEVEEQETEQEFLTEVNRNNITCYLKGLFLSKPIIEERLKKVNMLELFLNIEMPLTETLASMEQVGMHIHIEKLNEFDQEITEKLGMLEKEIYEIVGETFNIHSTQQLGVILFEKLNLPTRKKTKTGYSTDKKVLEELEEFHPVISKILEYRQLSKLKSTYVDGLRDKISEDARIHTTFMQTVTSTGRLSSIEPNLQNIPIRLELGSKIRTFFDAEGENVILDADYSQIELRLLAHIANDQNMIDAFAHDVDVHKVTASQVFNVPLEEVTPTMRSHAKAVNFGIVYGISEYGLSKNIKISIAEAKTYITNYLEKYAGIKSFMETIVEQAKKDGFVSTMFGRRRYIPELKQKNKNIIQFGERVAMNTPIQGTAADIIKIAMNDIYQKLKAHDLKSKLVMQVHDELLIEAIPEEVDIVKKLMKEAMENVIQLNVPLHIELNEGKNWYDAK